MKALLGFLVFVALFLFVASGNATLYLGTKAQKKWEHRIAALAQREIKPQGYKVYAVECWSVQGDHNCSFEIYKGKAKPVCINGTYLSDYATVSGTTVQQISCLGAPKVVRVVSKSPTSVGAA